jgi:hypothetical protein
VDEYRLTVITGVVVAGGSTFDFCYAGSDKIWQKLIDRS